MTAGELYDKFYSLYWRNVPIKIKKGDEILDINNVIINEKEIEIICN